jgi:hypothetical protein
MGIRFPLKTILDAQNNGTIGAASVNGGIAHTFNIPQDSDTIVVKLTASVAGAGVSTVLQTTDDGGTTWYDVARTSIVSNSAAGGQEAWIAGFVNAGGMATAQNFSPTNSILSSGIRSTAASTLSQNQVSGLPVLGTLGRVFHRIEAAATAVSSVRVQVKVNSESDS